MRKGRDGEKRGGKKEKTDDYSGHYVIASSRPPERRPLERRRSCQFSTAWYPPPIFLLLTTSLISILRSSLQHWCQWMNRKRRLHRKLSMLLQRRRCQGGKLKSWSFGKKCPWFIIQSLHSLLPPYIGLWDSNMLRLSNSYGSQWSSWKYGIISHTLLHSHVIHTI